MPAWFTADNTVPTTIATGSVVRNARRHTSRRDASRGVLHETAAAFAGAAVVTQAC